MPTWRTYKLATVPRGLTGEQALKVLQGIDRHSNVGRRDYAICQLLYPDFADSMLGKKILHAQVIGLQGMK